MEMANDYQLLIHLATTITAVCGAVIAVQKINKNARLEKEAFDKQKRREADQILQNAKEEVSLVKAKLEARIESLKVEVKNLEMNVQKDMNHLKETYTNEIVHLGKKIEDLRDELRQQSTGILELLTQIINQK